MARLVRVDAVNRWVGKGGALHGVGYSGLWPPLHCGTPQTLHQRLLPVPDCTPRPSHPSAGGNTRGLEMARPTRHVGAGTRGLLGPTAHGPLGRRHPGPCLSHTAGRGRGRKHGDSCILGRGGGHVPSPLGVWSLGPFSLTFFSTSSKKKKIHGSPSRHRIDSRGPQCFFLGKRDWARPPIR